MNAIQSSVPITATTRLLDKYILPKVALTVISIASFVGAWMTMTTHGAGTWIQVFSRWLHLISIAFLAGGFMWKGLFAHPANQPAQAAYFARFTAASFALYRRILRVGLPVFVLSASYDLIRFAQWGLPGALV